MATGDLTVFEEFSYYLGRGAFDLDAAADVLKLGITKTQPTAADASPAWSDYSAGAYNIGAATNPITTAATWAEVGGTSTLQCTSLTISKDATSEGSATAYAVLYDFTNASGRAIAFIELGTIDLTLSDVVIKFNNAASGELGTVVTVAVV